MKTDQERDADTRFLRENTGLHVGLLNRDEMARFHRLVHEGLAQRTYEGAAGLLGVAKVGRVVIGYGDGKKSPYGPTYADEVRGEFA